MQLRPATQHDLNIIIQMLADDTLGQTREAPSTDAMESYQLAFDRIMKDPGQELLVVENEAGEVVGTCQLSLIPYLTYKGGLRAQLEAVRIRSDLRGAGIGEYMFNEVIERAKESGAHMIQLTTDKKRPEAINFYKKLGMKDSHEGMKLHFKQ